MEPEEVVQDPQDFQDIVFEPTPEPQPQEVPLEQAIAALQRYGINPLQQLQQQQQVVTQPDPVEVAQREAAEAYSNYQQALQAGNTDAAQHWAMKQQEAQNTKLRLEAVREAAEQTRSTVAGFQANIRVEQTISQFKNQPGYNVLGRQFEEQLRRAVQANPVQYADGPLMEEAAKTIWARALYDYQVKNAGKKGTQPPGSMSAGDARAAATAPKPSNDQPAPEQKDRWGNPIAFANKAEWEMYEKAGQGMQVDF